MSVLNSTEPRWMREERFEPELTAAQIAAENLEPIVVHGITFYQPRAICAACAHGDHEQPATSACGCACHGRIPRKPAAIDYERLGYELAIGRAA